MNMWKKMRAQSAMEYLMTYGWAILIIAVVLGALFSLGVFSSSSFLGTACVPQSGFLCSNPVATPNTLKVTVGQATGASWSAVSVCFVPTGTAMTSNTCPSGGVTGNFMPSTTTLTSGQTVTAAFTDPSGITTIPASIGSGFSGAIWAIYNASGGTTPNLVTEIGTVTAKVS
ncbi:MAG: hypothetical protein ACP5T3_01420 [Candidatus Micrarchaeia archaeon]